MPTRRKAQPVKIVRLGINDLSPAARAEADRRAGGDTSRVEVIDANSFIVR